LARLAGADPDLLRTTPTDRVQFQSIGAALGLNTVLNAAALTFAFNQAGATLWPAVAPAITASLFLANLERYLLGSIVNESRWHKRLSATIPRLVITGLMSLVVSLPIVLAVFAPEVSVQVTADRQQTTQAVIEAAKKKTVEPLTAQQAYLSTEYNQANQAYQAEIAGSTGTAVAGNGPEALRRKAESDVLGKQLSDISAQVTDASNQVDRLAAQRQADDATLPAGLLERVQALGQLHGPASEVQYLLVILIMAIEVTPVLGVLMTRLRPPSTYEQIIRISERYAPSEHELDKLQQQAISRSNAQITAARHQHNDLNEEISRQSRPDSTRTEDTTAALQDLAEKLRLSDEQRRVDDEKFAAMNQRIDELKQELARDRDQQVAQVVPIHRRRAS
jgi:hypothetical protein